MTILPAPPTPAPTSLFARPERLRERAFVGYYLGTTKDGPERCYQHRPALDPPSVYAYRKGDPW